MTLEKVITLKKYNLKVIGKNAPSKSSEKGIWFTEGKILK